MAFTDKEIREAYIEDMTKSCPVRKVAGAWQNSVTRRGRLPEEPMLNRCDRIVKHPNEGGNDD